MSLKQLGVTSNQPHRTIYCIPPSHYQSFKSGKKWALAKNKMYTPQTLYEGRKENPKQGKSCARIKK